MQRGARRPPAARSDVACGMGSDRARTHPRRPECGMARRTARMRLRPPCPGLPTGETTSGDRQAATRGRGERVPRGHRDGEWAGGRRDASEAQSAALLRLVVTVTLVLAVAADLSR